MPFLYVFVGGSLGAVGRFAVGQWVARQTSTTLPVGTFVINVIGCLVIGFLTATRLLHTSALLLLDIGFTGAFTTFSTFSYETLRLLEEREFGPAFLNAGGSLGVGLLFVFAGYWLGQVFA